MGRRQRKAAEKAAGAMRDAIRAAARTALHLVEQPMSALREDDGEEGKRKRVLEDQRALREAIQAALERWGDAQ